MAHEEAPTITVTFLPAKSESSPDSRAPTRAPMENTDTTVPYKITIMINFNFIGHCGQCIVHTISALVSTSSVEAH